MILSDSEIHSRCQTVTVPPLVEPYIPENVQPASIDVRLGNKFLVPKIGSHTHIDLGDPTTFSDLTDERTVEDGDPFVIRPGQCVLAATKEWVNIPNDMKASIEGKSSIGRLFLFVHVTAGYIDPGFNGNVTLEMFNGHEIPIIVRPGNLIAQLAFHKMSRPAENPYQGRYQGDEGAAPSRYGVSPRTAGVVVDPGRLDEHLPSRSSRRDTLEEATDAVAERVVPGASRAATGHIIRHDRGMG